MISILYDYKILSDGRIAIQEDTIKVVPKIEPMELLKLISFRKIDRETLAKGFSEGTVHILFNKEQYRIMQLIINKK